MIQIVIPGQPIAQARARHARMKTKAGKEFVRTYNPQSSERENFVAHANQYLRGAEIITGPIRLELEFVMQRPKSHYGTGKNASILKVNAPNWHTSKPDRDNLEKFVKDALNGRAWRDDSQVCDGQITKRYGDTPRTIITITKL